MRKENKIKGITLIALIVTIIVLLILAGVTIVTLTGENGLLEKARLAKEKTEEKTQEEKDILSDFEDKIDNYNAREQNPSGTEDTQNNYLTEAQIDAKIASAIANANKEEILWTNQNPTSNFAAQTVTLSKAEYNRIYIVYKNYKSNDTSSYIFSEIGKNR